jgi:neopullulanase
MKKIVLILCFITSGLYLYCQTSIATYPTHWFTGMKNTKVQLLVHGENLATYPIAMVNKPGLKVEKIQKPRLPGAGLQYRSECSGGRIHYLING